MYTMTRVITRRTVAEPAQLFVICTCIPYIVPLNRTFLYALLWLWRSIPRNLILAPIQRSQELPELDLEVIALDTNYLMRPC